MNETNVTVRTAIEGGLRRRIEGSRKWASENQGAEFQTRDIRKHPARIRVLEFLDDHRKEGNGVKFRLFFGSETKRFFTDLEVRINPNWFSSEGKDDVPPYIAVYAIDKNGAGDGLHWFYISHADQLNETLEVSDWYVKYVNNCTRQSDDKKIMTHRQVCESGSNI